MRGWMAAALLAAAVAGSGREPARDPLETLTVEEAERLLRSELPRLADRRWAVREEATARLVEAHTPTVERLLASEVEIASRSE
jgi:hypothetical protein